MTAPLALPSGTVIAATNYRRHPEGIYLWTSADSGRTWGLSPDPPVGRTEETACGGGGTVGAHGRGGREGVWAELEAFTFGTPDLALLQDGSVLLTYYATLHV